MRANDFIDGLSAQVFEQLLDDLGVEVRPYQQLLKQPLDVQAGVLLSMKAERSSVAVPLDYLDSPKAISELMFAIEHRRLQENLTEALEAAETPRVAVAPKTAEMPRNQRTVAEVFEDFLKG